MLSPISRRLGIWFESVQDAIRFVVPNETLSLTEQTPITSPLYARIPSSALSINGEIPEIRFDAPLPAITLTLEEQTPYGALNVSIPNESLSLNSQTPQYRPLTRLISNETLTFSDNNPSGQLHWPIPKEILWMTPANPQYDQIEVEYAHADILLVLPEPVLVVTANDEDNAAIDLTLPTPELTIRVGASIQAELPAPLLTVTADSPGFATAALEIPAPVLTSQATVGEAASIVLFLPEPEVTATTGAWAEWTLPVLDFTLTASTVEVASMAFTLPYLTVAATGITGITAQIAMELPEPTVTSVATVGGSAVMVLRLPILTLQVTCAAVPTDTDDFAINSESLAYAINLHTGAVTQLDLGDTAFEKLVTAHGRLYGLRNGALVKLDGVTDQGTAIPATVRFAPQQFGTLQAKRMSDVYLNSREDDGLTLTLVQDETALWVYQTSTDFAPALGTHKVKVGRGVTFHSVGVILQNRNGGRMDVGGMELLVQPLSRKPR